MVLLLGAGGVVAWRATARADDSAARLNDNTPRVAVEVEPITSATLRDVRVLSGTLTASIRFDISAKIGGLLEGLSVDIGDNIARGRPIAKIDDDEFIQEVAQAQAELAVREAERDQARAQLERFQRDFDRLAALDERGVATDVELDEAEANLKVQQSATQLAEARVRQAEAALELARIRLGYTNVTAVWDAGPDAVTVGERYQDAGNTIQTGDALIGVVALDPLQAIASITERDYTRLRVGQTAQLTTDAVPDRVFTARIARIAPIFREASRQARVEFTVENADGVLKPGMFVRINLLLREAHFETVVPLAAVTKREQRDVVFVLSDDQQTVRMVPVNVDIIDDERAGLRESLTGDVVVVGQQLVVDGSPVRIFRSEADLESPEPPTP